MYLGSTFVQYNTIQLGIILRAITRRPEAYHNNCFNDSFNYLLDPSLFCFCRKLIGSEYQNIGPTIQNATHYSDIPSLAACSSTRRPTSLQMSTWACSTTSLCGRSHLRSASRSDLFIPD